MKVTLFKLTVILAALAYVVPMSNADEKDEHKHKSKVIAGPRGGRILDHTSPKAEFFLQKDNTAIVTFYDDALKPIPAKDQSVTLTADAKGAKKKIEFEKKGDVLATKEKLPQPDGYNIVLQLKESPEAKSQNHRFKLETHACGGCKRAEYACTCDE